MTPSAQAADVVVRLAADHLWQSTIVGLAAALVCVLLRRRAARVRYAVYLAASVKFLVPFALLTALGRAMPLPVAAPSNVEIRISSVWVLGQPFARETDLLPIEVAAAPAPSSSSGVVLPPLLLAVWLLGSLVMLARRVSARRRVLAVLRTTQPLVHGRAADAFRRMHGRTQPVRVGLRASQRSNSPCVVGITWPVLLWPEGVADSLSDAQLDAIMRHELSHIDGRDNLAGVIHASVEVLFWFHPLVWWLGKRLVRERERACDEAVLGAGTAPAEYADAILKVCERCLEPSAIGASGIAGSALTSRVEAIMSASIPKSAGSFVTTGLAIMVVVLLAGPVAVGAFGAQGTSISSPGRVSGVVTDQMNGVVPDVDVTVRARTTGSTRTAVTDQFGRYSVPGLAPDTYELRFTRAGFRPEVVGVDVGAGADVGTDARLRVGSVTESVTLIADSGAPVVGRGAPAQVDTQLLRRIAEHPDDVQAHLTLAELYYNDERFGESATVMERAAALWVAGRATGATSPTAPSGDIKRPTLIRRVNPIYPQAARAAGVTGMVILEAIIGEDGIVQDALVLRGNPVLHDAALGAVRQWIYEPTRLNGVPVAVAMTINFRFDTN
jgi:TonB family protein